MQLLGMQLKNIFEIQIVFYKESSGRLGKPQKATNRLCIGALQLVLLLILRF